MALTPPISCATLRRGDSETRIVSAPDSVSLHSQFSDKVSLKEPVSNLAESKSATSVKSARAATVWFPMHALLSLRFLVEECVHEVYRVPSH